MRNQALSLRVWAAILILPCGLLLVGCGASQGTISGKVSFKGKALRGGTVAIVPDKGGSFSSAIEEDGSYRIAKVPLGPAKLTVETVSVRPTAPRGYAPPAPPKDAIPAGVDQNQLPESLRSRNTGDKYVAIPEQYSDPQKSGLTYTVTGGTQEHNIDLK